MRDGEGGTEREGRGKSLINTLHAHNMLMINNERRGGGGRGKGM